jgi:hypothetical protein
MSELIIPERPSGGTDGGRGEVPAAQARPTSAWSLSPSCGEVGSLNGG